MDEAKEKDGPVSIAMESSLTVSETVVETMVCEGQIPMQEEGEEGPSNGDDIMVEVLGSHVYVDGICTTDGGDGGMNEAVHGDSGEVDLNPQNLESEGVTAGEADAYNKVSAAGVEGSGTDHNSGNDEGGRESRDANQALEAQNVGDLDGDDLNHGKQESVICSSLASEDSSVQTKVVEETMSYTKKEAADVDAKLSDVKKQIPAEDVPRSDTKDAAFSFQSTELAVESGLDEKINTNMETDKQCTGYEQKHMEVDIPHSSENHATLNDQSLKFETVIGGGEEVGLNMGAAMDVEKQVSDAKNDGFEPDVFKYGSDGGEATKVDDSVSNQMHSSHSMGNEDLLAESAASKDDSRVAQDVNGEEQVTSDEHDDLDQLQEMEVEEHDSESEHPTNLDEKTGKRMGLRSGSAIKVHRARYQLLPREEGEFSVSDLVWGKVRSHPWWPGQIFDPSDASEKAVKHHKKDTYLVAYFGDRTFAWNEASVLKPFRSHFSQIEKQSNSESFQNAVDCALDEVSRRTELGLACSCIPQDVYDKIKFQEVENAGVRQESSLRDVVDVSLSASSFEPDKLVDYMKALAKFPAGGGDRLDLAIAKAQLLAFYRLKGYDQLPEFCSCGDLSENETNISHSEEKMDFGGVIEHGTLMDTDSEQISSGQETSKTKKLKRKHNLKDGLYPCKRERSLTELMGGTFDSPDAENGSDGMANKLPSSSSGKKIKTVDSFEDPMVQEGRKTISLAKVSQAPSPKPSFKIGECIRRAASQMTASPSILKSTGDRSLKLDGGSENPAADAYDVPVDNFEDALQKMTNFMANNSSLEELLSQLHEAACNPMKSSFGLIVNFFSNLRDSIVVEQPPGDKIGGKRKKSPNPINGSPETFEFEDMNDTYWTDRIVQNGSEEKPSLGNGMGQYQIVPVQLEEKPIHKGRKSRKRYSDINHDLAAQKPPGYVDERAPAELVMNFTEINSIPSETKLNKMFKHFGPLKESETEVDRETSRARVVFRRTSDAEVAYNSAGKFNIFGPVAVNYQLNYTISESFKASLYAPTLAEENHHISSSLFGDHALGEENSLMHPSLGEEASFMVSTLGEETLPIATTFHEELHSSFGEGTLDLPTTLGNQTSVIGTSMYEDTMPISTSMYEHTMPIPASMYEETLPIAPSGGEGPMDVDTTMSIDDQTFIAATTVGEQFSTIVTTISEQTSTVASTVAEEAYPFSTTFSNETSTITTTLGEETSTVNVSLSEENSGIATVDQESSTIPTTLAEETPTYPVHLAEETPNIPRTLAEETPAIPAAEETPAIRMAEETPSIPNTLGEETPSIPLAEETLSLPSTLGEETPSIPLAEEPPSIPRTLGEETLAITLVEETPSIPRTLAEETSAIPLGKETPSVPKTLGEETPVIPATSSEETPTIPPTFSEETTTLPPTFNEETPTIPVTLGQETETIPTTMVEETVTTPETLGKETTTVPATLNEGTLAILTTLAEESQTTEVLGEKTPISPTNLGDETPISPTNLGEESSITPTTLAEETSTINTTLGEEASTDLIANGEETSTVTTTTEMETSPPNVSESKT